MCYWEIKREAIRKKLFFPNLKEIRLRVNRIFFYSNNEKIFINELSDCLAKDRLYNIGMLKSFYLPNKKLFRIRNA